MRLHNFINELGFNAGHDRDFPTQKFTVITFADGEKYNLEGKTHNLTSHAIKHLGEFMNVNSMVDEAKRLIIQNLKSAFLLNSGNVLRAKGTDIGSESVTDFVVLNTLDLINDKMVNRKTLNEIEKKFLPILTLFSQKYSEWIDIIKKQAIDIDKVSIDEMKNIVDKHGTISFSASGSSRITMDLTRFALIIERNNAINTMYIHKSISKSKSIPAFFNKVIVDMKAEPINQTVWKFLKGF